MHSFHYMRCLWKKTLMNKFPKQFTALCLTPISRCGYRQINRSCSSASRLHSRRLYSVHRLPNAAYNLRSFHNHVHRAKPVCASNVVESGETDTLFNQIKIRLDNGEMNGVELAQFVTEVQRASYNELFSVPWLHTDNVSVAFMQLVLNNKTDSFLGPVINNEVMQQVLQNLRECLHEVPDEQCPDLLMSLICVGVDNTDPLVSKLLDRLVDSTGHMDISRLAKVAEVLKSLQSRHFRLIERVIHRFQELLFDGTETDFVRNFCFLNIQLLSYMSKDLLEQCSERLLDFVERKQSLSDPEDIGACLHYCRKVHFAVGHRSKENALKIVDIALKSIPQVCNDLEPHHVSLYCHNLKKMHLYNGSVVDRLQDKSLEELSSQESRSLYIRDIIDYAFAFTRNCPLHVKKTLASLVIDKMEDMDVLTLSSLCEIMHDLHLYEPALVNAVETKTLELFDSLSLFMSKFSKVLYLLNKTQTKDTEFKELFIQNLIGLIEGIYNTDPRSTCIIAQYILTNVKQTIPDILMERLLAVIPQCNLKLMSNILDGLNLMQKPWLRQLHNQVLDLRICIQNNITERIESVSEVEVIIKIIKSSYLHTSKKDYAILETLMAHLPNVTKHLTWVQFNIMVTFLRRLNHYHPEVFEDLVKHMLENQLLADLQPALNLVGLLSKTGYFPQQAEAFSNFCSDLLESALANDVVGALSLAFDLAQLQIYPERSLGRIFSMEFLEQIDSHIDCDPDVRNFLEGLMMKLNRSVVLECPQLDVPWFHEEYCERKVNNKAKSSDFFEVDVEQILSEELGGKDYFKTGVFSPYYYYINFELCLDNEGHPVAVSNFDTSTDSHYQRVAVLLQQKVNFCTNSFHLKSYHLSKIRHLEILGYKVVLVPHYEWTSMALSDPTERAKYLREKICS